MAIAYVRENANGTGTTTPSTLTIANGATAGNVLILRVGQRMAAINVLTSVTDSKGNTWTIHVSNDNANGHANICSTAMNGGVLVASDTITLNWTVAPGNGAGFICDEFSGLDTSSSRLDQIATGSGSGTGRAAGTTPTTTQADELIVACYAGNINETSFTKDAAFTDFPTRFVTVGTTHFTEGQYRIVNATGAYSAPATGGTSLTPTLGAIATFKAAAAGVIVARGPLVVQQAVNRAAFR